MEVIQFRRPTSDRQWAAAWGGVLAMMEANGRTKVEVGIEDVRRIARIVGARAHP